MPELKEEDVQLRSGEVQEILSHIPTWIIRWGITLIFCIIMLLLTGAWFVRYPEIIISRVSVITENPPLRLFAQTSGKIKLLTKDKNHTNKNQYLVVIENAANTEDVTQLKNMLDENLALLTDNIDSLKLNTESSLQLGDLQNDYAILKQNYLNFHYFLEDNYYQHKIKTIQNQYDHYKNLDDKLSSQKEILAKELALSEKRYNNDKELYKKEVIAEVDLTRSESDYLQKKYAYKNAEIGLVTNQIQLDEYEKTMMDLQQQFLDKKRQFVVGLQESYKKLLASIGSWEQHFVLKTTIEGTVSFAQPFSDGQFVNMNTELLTVVPPSNNVVAKVFIPSIGSGKVKNGQRVNIKLDNYPFKEFGMIEGKVENISLVSSNNNYLVNVSLPKGLLSSYNKPLEFKQEMTGTAEIITKDLSLLERIFNQIRSAIKRST